MKAMILSFVLWLFSIVPSIAQKVFSVNYASQADVKVYIVQYESQADLKVYKVKYESEVTGNDGKCFLLSTKAKLSKKYILLSMPVKQRTMSILMVDK